LEVNHGEFLYIIGKTGSGKSSLMKTLYADLPLVEGEAHIVDFDLATLKKMTYPFKKKKNRYCISRLQITAGSYD
jgi:cell division transport system ATP-binding protein